MDTHCSTEGFKPCEGFIVRRGGRVSSLHGNHKNKQDDEQEKIEHDQGLEEQEIGENAGSKATTDLLKGIMPGVESMEEGKPTIPEISEALQGKQENSL